ncbi:MULTISPECIES: TIM barrel protein [Bacillus cereus group]|nr:MULTISPECIES: TIM barrel protein [Bacillus cereus group]
MKGGVWLFATRMKIGFHIRFAGNLKRLSNDVIKTRGNVFQFFSRSIRGGRMPDISERQLQNYYNFLFERRISNVIVLAPYGFKVAGKDVSSNLAVPNEIAIREILKDLEFAKEIHAKYYVVNAGYSKGLSEFESIEILKMQLNEILQKTTWNGDILVKNMAGGGTELAADLYRWKEIISFNERIKGALDFGRAFSFGYSFLTKAEAEVFLKFIETDIGWDKIPLIYINDSNRFAGSKREDVVPLGDGVIGFHGYKNILNNKDILEKIWMIENQPDVIYYDRTINFLVEFHRNNKEKGGGL